MAGRIRPRKDFMEVSRMDKQELLERYEALGEEGDYRAARPLYEQALAEHEDPQVLVEYGYLLEGHGRNEIRRAAEQYERAIGLDPESDKLHYHLISARAALREAEGLVAVYEQRLASSPHELREYRFLTQAYLVTHAFAEARRVAEAGLELAPDDPALIGARGEAKAGLGDVAGALADWRRALELDPDDIGGLYSSAFLFEREGRLAEAIEAWEAIIAWCEDRGYVLQTAWPRQEVERLRGA